MNERGKKDTEIADEVTEDTQGNAPAGEETEESKDESTLEEQIEVLRKERQEADDRLVRLAAEYDNFRKRTNKEKTEMYSNAKAQTAAAFLKVADTLERAVGAETEENEHKKGLMMILEQFQGVLKELDIEEIKAQGEKFNPDLHNAVSQTEDPEFGENTVCQVYEKGYKLGDRVLRHAIVVVANP